MSRLAKMVFVAEQPGVNHNVIWKVGLTDDPARELAELPQVPPFKLRETFSMHRDGLIKYIDCVLSRYHVPGAKGFYDVHKDERDSLAKKVADEIKWWNDNAKVYKEFDELNVKAPAFDDDEAEEVGRTLMSAALKHKVQELRFTKDKISQLETKKNLLETEIKVAMLKHTPKCDTLDAGDGQCITWKWQDRKDLDKKALAKRVGSEVMDECTTTKRIRVMRS